MTSVLRSLGTLSTVDHASRGAEVSGRTAQGGGQFRAGTGVIDDADGTRRYQRALRQPHPLLDEESRLVRCQPCRGPAPGRRSGRRRRRGKIGRGSHSRVSFIRVFGKSSNGSRAGPSGSVPRHSHG